MRSGHKSNLTPELVLEFIREHPRCEMADIAEAYNVTTHTVRGRLNKVRDQVEVVRVWRSWYHYIKTHEPPKVEKIKPLALITQLWVPGIELEAA